MYNYLLSHEKQMNALLHSGQEQNWENIKTYHLIQIGFMQHERLIHLLVTLAVTFITLGAYIVSALYPCTALFLLDSILSVLEIFYMIHYFRLENGVQRWYVIYNQLCEKCDTSK